MTRSPKQLKRESGAMPGSTESKVLRSVPRSQVNEENLSEADLSHMALFINGGHYRSLMSNPVREVASELKGLLQSFVRDNRDLCPEMGFHSRSDCVSIGKLLERLDSFEEKLEGVVVGTKAPESLEVRALAISLQAGIEMFTTALHRQSDNGELSLTQLPKALGDSIQLKAETNAVLLNLEAAQHQLADAPQMS